ncbi:lipoate--protein ligase family protein [Aquibacillus koreensis]|uniref:Octanoyl-[GcvH]:protein N-octanoyltransferase n=1 Tax=Aquibacillus koreensis TaxID=279446 RepID=A0A9X4AII9_9BACI|nr:lipoate--protein ligase family protein [Aquibacillus koreensis]MCT2538268.1 lipoate--protein ligase family protein [Aquibacillus koreensis]MDC3420789.1 lipoate--protein ligase family protein [Aquibacillus koreensis]
MENWKDHFRSSPIRYIDHSDVNSLPSAMASFAVDDALAISVGNGTSSPTVRLWVHDRTIVLGIPDARLPFVAEGIGWLQTNGYRTVVRNSGGLAVVLDTGVLNVSLILPDVKKLGIHEGYQAMVDFTKYIFRDLTDKIEAFEVTGSYCPGEYDLSINGKKFAGISQRRVKNGSAIQIYLCVEGDGSERAALIRAFYKRGLQGEKGRFDYPTIEPETMKSLAELLSIPLTMEEVKSRIFKGIANISPGVVENDLQEIELEDFQKRMEQMIDRNEKALGDLA